MSRTIRLAGAVAIGILCGVVVAQEMPPIDMRQVRELHQRDLRGETLSPSERERLDRARAARAAGQQPNTHDPVASARPSTGLIPLCDMGADQRYQGEDGGLYGGGRNTPPEAHAKAALAAAASIRPLDQDGHPSPDGTIVLTAFSMSNATQEFTSFKRLADVAPEKSTRVTIVDCAQGGQAMAAWARPDGTPWTVAGHRLEAAGVTPLQVQVAWIKLANRMPTGSLENHGRILERDALATIQNARARFPNLRIVYLGSRTYGGYATIALNPEPYAYESAFVARWLILRQIDGDPELNFDPARGPVKAPLLLWGPYLWADGVNGREMDDLVWEQSDFVADGVHPSSSGRVRVARQLLSFFTSDPVAASWFAPR